MIPSIRQVLGAVCRCYKYTVLAQISKSHTFLKHLSFDLLVWYIIWYYYSNTPYTKNIITLRFSITWENSLCFLAVLGSLLLSPLSFFAVVLSLLEEDEDGLLLSSLCTTENVYCFLFLYTYKNMKSWITDKTNKQDICCYSCLK